MPSERDHLVEELCRVAPDYGAEVVLDRGLGCVVDRARMDRVDTDATGRRRTKRALRKMDEEDGSPLMEKEERRRKTNAAGAAGDDADLVAQERRHDPLTPLRGTVRLSAASLRRAAPAAPPDRQQAE